ncbi:MAG: hypothetical protein Q7S17_05185 [Xanthobacteraceae bacterium]|nr:hypothetical protein [Xanthobacteraceae bacterium]
MNFRTILDDHGPRIVKTGAAVGPYVFGELHAARMALRAMVEVQIGGLRFSRDAALKMREGDLLSETGDRILREEPSLDIPPAPSEAGPGSVGRDQDDLTDLPAHLRRTPA